jgi:hypothetical protein
VTTGQQLNVSTLRSDTTAQNEALTLHSRAQPGKTIMAKTIKIDAIKAAANQLLRESVNDHSKERQAVHYFVADLLMKADAYKGFSYLAQSQVPDGHTFGIVRDPTGGTKHSFPDPSRTEFI